MAIAAYVCLIAVAVIMGGFYSVIKRNGTWSSVLLKGLAPLSCLILGVVSATLSSSYSAFTLCAFISFSILIMLESYSCACIDTEKSKLILSGMLNFLSIFLFALAGILLIDFIPWGIVGGICLGLGFTLIFAAFKNDSFLSWSMFCLSMSASFVIVGQGICLLLNSTLLPSLLYLFGGLLFVSYLIMKRFAKHEKQYRIIENALKISACIIMAAIIYLL